MHAGRVATEISEDTQLRTAMGRDPTQRRGTQGGDKGADVNIYHHAVLPS